MKKSRDPLEVPPKKWKNAASLQSLAGQLRVAAETSEDGATVVIDIGSAWSILEALCQAIHTERQHKKP